MLHHRHCHCPVQPRDRDAKVRQALDEHANTLCKRVKREALLELRIGHIVDEADNSNAHQPRERIRHLQQETKRLCCEHQHLLPLPMPVHRHQRLDATSLHHHREIRLSVQEVLENFTGPQMNQLLQRLLLKFVPHLVG
jgi:hypothetical protein